MTPEQLRASTARLSDDGRWLWYMVPSPSGPLWQADWIAPSGEDLARNSNLISPVGGDG